MTQPPQDAPQGRADVLQAAAGVPVARKDDLGKLPWGLLPFDALEEVVKVLRHGAAKYGTRNWESGFEWSRLFDASLRHHVAFFQRGERVDPDTGLSHLAHAGCCVLFLLAHELRGIGTDDRPARILIDPVRSLPVAADGAGLAGSPLPAEPAGIRS